jgi:hypothetical protein
MIYRELNNHKINPQSQFKSLVIEQELRTIDQGPRKVLGRRKPLVCNLLRTELDVVP